MNISDLQSPEKVQKLLQRFTAVWDANTGAGASPIETLYAGSAGGGMSVDLLYSLQKLKR